MTAKNINKLKVKVLDINPDKLKLSLNNISIYAVINKMYVKKELIRILKIFFMKFLFNFQYFFLCKNIYKAITLK